VLNQRVCNAVSSTLARVDPSAVIKGSENLVAAVLELMNNPSVKWNSDIRAYHRVLTLYL
jgi:hypothetical protein